MTRSLTRGLALWMYVRIIKGWRVKLVLYMLEVTIVIIIIIIIIVPIILRSACNVITDVYMHSIYWKP